MNTLLRRFGAYVRDHFDERLDDLYTRVVAANPSYARQQPDNLRAALYASAMAIAEALVSDNLDDMINYCEQISRRRAQENFPVKEVVTTVSLIRRSIWELLDAFLASDGTPWPPVAFRDLEDTLHTFGYYIVMGFGEALRNALDELALQETQLEAQRSTIRELSTPILPIYPGVIVLPLVGMIDSYRAGQVMENLLSAIAERQSDIVILDITGVPIVDTSVANYLLQTTRAARLVGAQVILVGIGAEIAQTIVQLGVDLSGVMVHANLQAGIEHALDMLGHAIR